MHIHIYVFLLLRTASAVQFNYRTKQKIGLDFDACFVPTACCIYSFFLLDLRGGNAAEESKRRVMLYHGETLKSTQYLP